jgi:hypothetical protein
LPKSRWRLFATIAPGIRQIRIVRAEGLSRVGGFANILLTRWV